MRASDASWQGGLLPWLRRLERNGEGQGGALVILDNAEELLAPTGTDNPQSGSSAPNAHVRFAPWLPMECILPPNARPALHLTAGMLPRLPGPVCRRGWERLRIA